MLLTQQPCGQLLLLMILLLRMLEIVCIALTWLLAVTAATASIPITAGCSLPTA